MRHIGTALHILAATAIIAAIWTPWHWQMAATAVLLFLAGAMAHGSAQLAKTTLDQPASTDGRYDADGNPASADSPGPYSAEEIAAQIEKRAAQQAALRPNRPTYGKQADS